LSNEIQYPLIKKIPIRIYYCIQFRLKENEDWDESIYFVSSNFEDVEKQSQHLIKNKKHVQYRIIKVLIEQQYSVVE